ncbi:hypothetical protein G6F65_022027 [Rhizopus arrhizus]|nr:hypothetical protein G6F65_022027 [Rhizopus arrhizus]
MACGVPAGATIPYQATLSAPGRPASATVGTSGSRGERLASATAKARSWPDFTNDRMGGTPLMTIWVRPPRVSVMASLLPL